MGKLQLKKNFKCWNLNIIGVCIDTNVIYQRVLEKKTYLSYISQKT